MQNSGSRLTLATVASAGTIALALGGISPAFAVEDEVDIARIVAEVAPDQGGVVAVQAQGDRLTADVNGAVVSIPDDGTGIIDVVTEDSNRFSIPLPNETSITSAEVMDDGTVVYPSAHGGGVTVLVQTLETDSVRVQTVVEAPTAAAEFSYEFEGELVPAIDQDGTVAIIDTSDSERARILVVDDPWAFDAEGHQVDTHYEVHGQTLVQVIEPDGDAVYPIVADPRWEWRDWGYGATFSRGETRNIADAAGVSSTCGVVGYYAGGAGIACAAIAGYVFAQANIAKSNRQCIIIQVVPSPSVWRVGTAHGCYG